MVRQLEQVLDWLKYQVTKCWMKRVVLLYRLNLFKLMLVGGKEEQMDEVLDQTARPEDKKGLDKVTVKDLMEAQQLEGARWTGWGGW